MTARTMSERRKAAYAQAEKARARFYGGKEQIILGNPSIKDLISMACRYNVAWAYRRLMRDEIGALLIAVNGWSWDQANERRIEREQAARAECACALPEQSCPTCIQAAAVVAEAVAPDGFPF
jgi:hypothetical protein